MPRKTQAAIFCCFTKDGRRTYKAFDRQGKELTSTNVHDSGYGANQAYKHFEALDIQVSIAEWIWKLLRELRNKGIVQE